MALGLMGDVGWHQELWIPIGDVGGVPGPIGDERCLWVPIGDEGWHWDLGVL